MGRNLIKMFKDGILPPQFRRANTRYSSTSIICIGVTTIPIASMHKWIETDIISLWKE